MMKAVDVKKTLKNPKFFGFALIIVFFIVYVFTVVDENILPVFVICTISIILSSFAIFFDFKFLNSIVIGYWGLYLATTIADIVFGAGWIGIHLINLILSTYIFVKRWKKAWPSLIFLSGFLWATIIGTQKMVTKGESPYFRMFNWQLLSLLIMFNGFIALLIYLAQEPKKGKKNAVLYRRR